MKEWYSQLTPRERYVLLVGGIVALLIIYWGLVWRPLTLRVGEAREVLASQQALLTDLRRAQNLVEPARQGSGGGQSLVVLVDRTHRDQGLAGSLSRNQPDGPDGIRVTLQDADFDALMAWLAVLQQNHGVAVESASINGSRTPGLVSATLVLRRS